MRSIDRKTNFLRLISLGKVGAVRSSRARHQLFHSCILIPVSLRQTRNEEQEKLCTKKGKQRAVESRESQKWFFHSFVNWNSFAANLLKWFSNFPYDGATHSASNFPIFSTIFDWYSIDYNTKRLVSFDKSKLSTHTEPLVGFYREISTLLSRSRFSSLSNNLFLRFSYFLTSSDDDRELMWFHNRNNTRAHSDRKDESRKIATQWSASSWAQTQHFITPGFSWENLLLFRLSFPSPLLRPTSSHSSLLNVCFALIRSSFHWKSIESTDVEEWSVSTLN